MYKIISLILLLLTIACTPKITKEHSQKLVENKQEIVIAFGSCNNQNLPNPLWGVILKNNPDLFIWGGDIIYSDTEDMQLMQKNYTQQKLDSNYQNFINKVPTIGTWDDHDYGQNDGGKYFIKKDSVQQLFLDFFDVAKNSPRRNQKGVYFSKILSIGNNTAKIIILDTRFFRDSLTHDPSGKKRYIPSNNGTLLGKTQWQWLDNELKNSDATFNIIVSSIQFLSYQHGFESWGNMPHEVTKLEKVIANSNAKGVIIISGDRHIAEISKAHVSKLSYPLIDFTASGMTHTYSQFNGEPNQYRISKVIFEKNFGLLKLNFEKKQISMEIRGENNKLLEQFLQQY